MRNFCDELSRTFQIERFIWFTLTVTPHTRRPGSCPAVDLEIALVHPRFHRAGGLNILHSMCSSSGGDQAALRDRAFRLKVFFSVSPAAVVKDQWKNMPSEPHWLCRDRAHQN